jgi:hypothetical protein
MPMTPASAARISAAFGCALPTRLLVDAIDRAAEVRLDPRPMTAAREAVTTFVVHNAIIEEQRTGAPLGPIVSGAKKDLVLTKLLEARPDRVAIYGWRRGDGRPIQPLSTVHAASYVDYSHGVRLVWRTVLVDGKEMDYYRILADPVLSALVSDEGQFRPRL